ncbi:hypothetical protein NDU88_006080 [Pleurodeles waltl]|uniref:Uncharacterized protein n=1 Tax=Pleurodeles waltl TaxID=8319 RepID=A0AAV7RQ79_PLEWA|nr:hypothetical protein NDU88_006080 [Pleurodeles waltl]
MICSALTQVVRKSGQLCLGGVPDGSVYDERWCTPSERRECAEKVSFYPDRCSWHGLPLINNNTAKHHARKFILYIEHVVCVGNEGLDYGVANREKPYFILGRYA